MPLPPFPFPDVYLFKPSIRRVSSLDFFHPAPFFILTSPYLPSPQSLALRLFSEQARTVFFPDFSSQRSQSRLSLLKVAKRT